METNEYDKYIRQGFLWNTAAGLLDAAEAVILSAVVTRTTGLTDAGILAIAFAVGNLFMSVGKFGMRNFQVTDMKEEYSFFTYLKSRIITTAVMLMMALAYIFWGWIDNGYSIEKIKCILLICLIYMIESLEDVFWGKYQNLGRLDLGAKMFCLRWGVILAISCILLYLGKSLSFSLASGFIVSTLSEGIMIVIVSKRTHVFSRESAHGTTASQWRLLRVSAPFCAVSFMNFYLINAPKYAIDIYLTDEQQACYGFIAMPVFVIGLLNSFIYQPILVHMASMWSEKRTDKLKKCIIRQIIIILGTTIAVEIVAYLLGIPVLSWLYATDLTTYKMDFLVMIFAGGILAVVQFFTTILTMVRARSEQFILYATVSLGVFFTERYFVKTYAITGAVGSYTMAILVLAVAMGAIVCSKVRGRC